MGNWTLALWALFNPFLHLLQCKVLCSVTFHDLYQLRASCICCTQLHTCLCVCVCGRLSGVCTHTVHSSIIIIVYVHIWTSAYDRIFTHLAHIQSNTPWRWWCTLSHTHTSFQACLWMGNGHFYFESRYCKYNWHPQVSLKIVYRVFNTNI